MVALATLPGMQKREIFIPSAATQVLFLEQSAHCDWDWMVPFLTYYADGYAESTPEHQAVRATLTQAARLVADNPQYVYAFCEAAYLQAFMDDPDVPTLDKLRLRHHAGERFLFSSGGLTSAENLTLHTEAFIRNYLLGRQWLWNKFGVTASNRMWIPDDFGHDAQLPVLLQAMGMTGAGFWRIPYGPGIPTNGSKCGPALPNAPSAFLPGIGLDFQWQAADGSQVQAHWLSNGYCEGNGSSGFQSESPYGGATIDNGQQGIQTIIEANTLNLIQPPPYLFAPIDCDFTQPFYNLPQVINEWNGPRFGPNPQPDLPYPTTWVVQGTFDEFMSYVAAAGTIGTVQSNPLPSSGNPTYVPHPYFAGCYGSRPLLKSLHYLTTRTLLLTESMELVLEMLARRDFNAWGSSAQEAIRLIEIAWNLLAPSTHHDYITGTAPDTVYQPEQVAMLQDALAAAEDARGHVLREIASAIDPIDRPGAHVALFNGLGFDRAGVADLANVPAVQYQSSTTDGATYFPLQYHAKGVLLFATVPSMGFQTATLSAAPSNGHMPGFVKAEQDNGVVRMWSDFVYAEIDLSGVINLMPQGHTGNVLSGPVTLAFYNDTGNIYRFANEMPCYGYESKFLDSGATFENALLELEEQGPLRARALFTGSVKIDRDSYQYTIAYELYANDKALRVTVHGAAPSYYSVMARVPFVLPAECLTYGTTAHWDTRAPRSFFLWDPAWDANFEKMTFEPTHELVVGRLNGDGYQVGGIYHYATPGWAIDSSGALLGCILRNTPGGGNGAQGTDNDPHTVSFAIRPGSMGLPEYAAWGENIALSEALDLHNPLVAVELPETSRKALGSTMSILHTKDERVLVTAAKAGTVSPDSMIVRVSKPPNYGLDSAVVNFDPNIAAGYRDGNFIAARSATALETAASQNDVTSTTATSVTVDLPYALATLALGPAPPER